MRLGNPLRAIVAIGASLAVNDLTETGLGDTGHRLSLGSQMVYFQTAIPGDEFSVTSPLGFVGEYSFQAGFSTLLFANYSLALSGEQVMLHGLGAGLDVAVFGGQSKTLVAKGDSVYRFRFPFRLGLFLAASQGNYDIAEVYKVPALTLEEGLPLEGAYIGVETGLSLDWPLGPIAFLKGRASYTLPYFATQGDQLGSIMRVTVGGGVRL